MEVRNTGVKGPSLKGENVFDLLSKFIFQFIYHLSYLVLFVKYYNLKIKPANEFLRLMF
jgi:hypothetical protein